MKELRAVLQKWRWPLLYCPSVVCIYQKRWAIEIMNWELQSGLGLGEHQVSGDKNRREKSVGIAVLAYLFVMRVCHHEIGPGKPCSTGRLHRGP